MRAGSPRAARSPSTPASTPDARRRTSSSSGSRAPRSGSGGATSTPRSPRSTSRGCARRWPRTSAPATTSTSIDAFAGADPKQRIAVRVVTGYPYHALFARTMFIDPTEDELRDFEPQALVLHAPGARVRPGRRRHAQRHLRRAPSLAPGGADRRHLLRGRDQEVDLHADERPPAARGRLPDALLGERRRGRRRRDLLRPLRHGQDDALRRSRALADRRRRARLGRRRRLQLRGRLLRKGDPPLGRGRARDLQDDAHVRDDPRERRRSTSAASSTSTTSRRPRTRARPTSSSRSRTRCRPSAPATRSR